MALRRLLPIIALLLAAGLVRADAVELGYGNTTGYVVTTCGAPSVAFKAGNPGPFTVDVNGNLCFTTGVSTTASGIAPVVSAAAESSHVLKATPGVVYSAYATNLTATAGFLVLLNATSAPGDGAITPLDCVPLPANGNASINYGSYPPGKFSTGIVAVVTSAATCFTKTTGVITAFIKGIVQ